MPAWHILFRAASRVPLDRIKLQFCLGLSGCNNSGAQCVGCRTNGATTADELWQLRSELHQRIFQRYSQSEVVDRINSLLPSLERWISASQCVRI